MVICIEAGSKSRSGDQEDDRRIDEGATIHLAMNSISWCWSSALERPRADCWKNMADRTDVDSLRNLVSVLVQSEQFGTSISKTLRTHSDTLRTQRIQKVEEMAAKDYGEACFFRWVLFIFPSLFIVVLGPAMITMGGFVQNFTQIISKKGDLTWTLPRLSGFVAGALFVIVLIVLIQRRRTRVK